jgi:hypothetical protein
MMPALGAGGRWFESGRPHYFCSNGKDVMVFHLVKILLGHLNIKWTNTFAYMNSFDKK